MWKLNDGRSSCLLLLKPKPLETCVPEKAQVIVMFSSECNAKTKTVKNSLLLAMHGHESNLNHKSCVAVAATAADAVIANAVDVAKLAPAGSKCINL